MRSNYFITAFMIAYQEIFEKNAFSYQNYRELVDDLLAKGQTTGPDHSEAMLHYSKMNVQRMNRVEKTTIIDSQVAEAIKELKQAYHFLIITEGWCGDAAQIVPVINKVAELSPETFDLKLVLRDQNLELIDAHLTNGGRAIPVLLVLDENFNLVEKWGPRPAVLQRILAEWKQTHSDQMEIATLLHGWYAKDKTQAIQQELLVLLRKIKEKELVALAGA